MPLMFDPAALNRYALIAQLDPGSAPDPAPSSAEGPHVGVGPYAALMGGQAADLATTIAALRQPGMEEKNPVGLGSVLAAKAGTLVGGPLALRYLAAHGHPTAAKVVGYLTGAMGAVPAGINLSRMRR